MSQLSINIVKGYKREEGMFIRWLSGEHTPQVNAGMMQMTNSDTSRCVE